MITQNLHMHSTWDDGKCSVEEMILASKAAGLRSVGVSVHCPMPFPNEWECPKERIPDYIAQVRALEKRYAGEIDVYLGIEWDVSAKDIDLTPYDYVIGSAHQLPLGGDPSVDESAEATARALDVHFDGDADAMAEMYFAEIEKVANEPKAAIVGHFDLLTKFDETHHFFDENSPRYQAAARKAMEKLVKAGKIFEVNTGAISRGYRSAPYPSAQWLRLLREMGGRVTVSADAHHTSGVTCAFDLAEKLVQEAGFREIWVFQKEKFVPVSI